MSKRQAIRQDARSNDSTSQVDNIIGLERDTLLARAIGLLESQPASVVRRHFGLHGSNPESIEEISVALNLPRDEVERLLGLALAGLRENTEVIHFRQAS